jgi:hypothetical protein
MENNCERVERIVRELWQAMELPQPVWWKVRDESSGNGDISFSFDHAEAIWFTNDQLRQDAAFTDIVIRDQAREYMERSVK